MLARNDNVLKLEDAHLYSCQLWNYGSGLNSLTIRAFKGDYLTGDVRFLHFSGALYFSGPFQWKSANLTLKSQDECLELLFKISDSFRRFPTEELGKQWNLYNFQGKHFCIEILANEVSLGIIDEEGLFRDAS